MRKPRHLSPEERDLWNRVTARAEPLDKRPKRKAQPSKSVTVAAENAPKPQLPAFQVGQKVDHRSDHDLMASISDQLKQAPVRMDAKTHGKMNRGKLKPEARIDLHGMTLAEAHPALISFILHAQASGHRFVLVITGKGRDRIEEGPIPVRHGRLRHEVPHWLQAPPLRNAVLQVTEAHRRHGGHGALYVYLRRNR